MTHFLLPVAGIVLGIFTGVGVLAHIAARFGWHKRIIPVKVQDLSKLGVLGKANPWRIVLHDTLSDSQRRQVLAHEWQHVTDKWLLGLVGFDLWRLIDRDGAVLWLESRGFARSAANGRPFMECARALASGYYDLGITIGEAERAIRRAP